MSQVFVLPSASDVITSSEEFAMLGFRSILRDASISGADGSAIPEDPDHPFSFCTDFSDDTQYSPDIDSGTVTIEIRTDDISTVDYIGIAIHNGQDASLSGELQRYNGAGYDTINSFGSLRNNFPYTIPLSEAYTSNRWRIVLNFTSKLYIGAIHIGESIRFGKTPSVGLTPPRYNRLDQSLSFTTEGNNFTRGRVIERGNQCEGEFRFYAFEELEQWYLDYMTHAILARPVFFRWSSLINDPIYGRQNLSSSGNPLPAIQYDTSLHCRLRFDFRGYAAR